jgi:hypothetical protein
VFSPTGQRSRDRPESAAQARELLTTSQGVGLPDTDYSLKAGERRRRSRRRGAAPRSLPALQTIGAWGSGTAVLEAAGIGLDGPGPVNDPPA